MEVILTECTVNPVKSIERAAANCYDSSPDDNGKIMNNCYNSGHHSVLEFADFTFHISGISRALTHQLVRHRHASYAQRSQRYCSSFGDSIPPLPSGDKKTNPQQRLYDNQEKKIVELYNKGYSSEKLGRIYNIPSGTVCGIIRKHQTPKSLSESKNINKNYFTDIDTSIKAYILGFIYADGCMSIKNNGNKQIIVDQLDCEELLLRNILREIKPNGNIIKCGHDNMIRIAVQDNDICTDLEKYGIISRKGTLANFNPILELVDDMYIKDVIRGVFEGDGHVHVCCNNNGIINDAVFEIAGTLNTCEQIQSYLIKKLGLNNVAIQHNGNQNYKLRYGGRVQVTKIIKWLYEDIDVNFLHSKKAKVVFELVPELKEYYKKQITEIVHKKYESVIPPSFFKNVDAVNGFINCLEVIKSTYVSIQEKLASCGLYGEDANQDARYLLPNACETVIEVKMNGRELIHFCNERLCTRAQWEIRKLAKKMKACVAGYNDECKKFSSFLVPKCQKCLGYPFCTEYKSCGLAPKLSDVYKAYIKAQERQPSGGEWYE
jgi:thymidylate synthase ThyX